MRTVISMNQDWQFAKLPGEDISRLPEHFPEMEEVKLPHTWYADGAHYYGAAVYQKELELAVESDQEAYLEFNGADRWCRVYLNDVFLGEHEGGYSVFRVKIDRQAVKAGKNVLTVLLDNRDKGYISPLAGDFTIYGGLYRDVNLILVSENHFDLMFYGSCGLIVRASVEEGCGVLALEPHVCVTESGCRIAYEVLDEAGSLVGSAEEAAEKTAECRISNPFLWDGKEKAHLYTVKAKLLQNGVLCDAVELRTGFKEIRMDAEQGFFLNGNHLLIQGVAKHQDYAQVFSAAGPEQWERDMELLEEIGANAVRLSHYEHPQYFYDLCDRRGMVVWAEIPMLKMLEDERCIDNACQQMKELIYQNIHHPSICFWGFQNEIAIFGEEEYMYGNCQRLRDLIDELDPNRLSAAANLYSVKNESQLNQLSDIVGYNIYFGWYYGEMKDYDDFLDSFHRDCPNVPLGISEYGVDCNLQFHQEQPKVKDYSEEYQALFHETVYGILKTKPYLWGSFVWNMFDFGSARRNEGGTMYYNCKGLVTFDRSVNKDAFYYYKAQWSKEPFVHIAEHRFEKRAKESIRVKVYSNQKEVELIAGGVTYKVASDNGIFSFDEIPLVMGENQMTAVSGACEDKVVFVRTEEPEAAYTFVDPNPEINVRNWFLDDQEQEKLFPEEYCSVMDSVYDLVHNPEAMEVIEAWSMKLADGMRSRKATMPLYRVINFMRAEFKEEQVKELNQSLTKIKKLPETSK